MPTTHSLSPEAKEYLAVIREWLPRAKHETDESGNRVYTDEKRDAYIMPLLNLLDIKVGNSW
jgi:hypothetical protein